MQLPSIVVHPVLPFAPYALAALFLVLVLIDTWRPSGGRRAELEAEDDEYGWDWLEVMEL